MVRLSVPANWAPPELERTQPLACAPRGRAPRLNRGSVVGAQVSDPHFLPKL